MIINILRGLLGICFLIGVCFAFSSNRKAIDWVLVVKGILLQLVLGILILYVPFIKAGFEFISGFFLAVLSYTEAGAKFVLGDWPAVAQVTDGISGKPFNVGYIFAFKVLPTILFFSALSSLLYYLGILQRVVFALAWVMKRFLRLSGAESLSAAANIFVGQTEAPLLIKPYLDRMGRSEIMCLMTGGMATIAGGVFAAYVGFLGGDSLEQQQLFATHLLIASIMSAPAAIVAPKILVPLGDETIDENLEVPKDKIGSNVLEAITNGTADGLRLAVNVGAMLLVFIALMAMVNSIVGNLGNLGGINEWVSASTNGKFPQLSLQYILGVIFAPIAWIIGVPTADIMIVGQLLGERTIINEFVAYVSLGGMKSAALFTSQKSSIIATYALCGFANFSSIGIQIGGIGSLSPQQRPTLSELGFKSLIGGTVACLLTATVAGMLL